MIFEGVPIYGPYDETGRVHRWGGSIGGNGTSRLDTCNGRVRPTDGRYVYHMTPSPPYTVGCFRGGRGLGVATGRALQKECPSSSSSSSSSSSVMDDDITPLHDATHHTSTNMCGMSKTATSVVAAATNIDGSLDGSSTIGSVR